MTRRGLLITAGVALTGLLIPVVLHPAIRLLWNVTASAPIGLYAVRPIRRLAAGDLIVVKPPGALARYAAERRYLPLGVPLIKPVAATAGHTVCRSARTIIIDDHPVAQALGRDGHGRSLPVWQGCHVLAAGEIFVMNPAVRDSFDGRYFGPLPITTVLGRARPLWTEPSLHPSPRS